MATDIPPDGERERRLDEALAAYHCQVDGGRTPDRVALLADHPDLAADLKAYFAEEDRLNRWAAPLREVSQAAWLDTLPLPAESATPSPAGDSGPAAPAERFGDYDLLQMIARGGMGAVYKARHRPLNRLVALKMITAGRFASAAERQRFRNEAEAVAGLDHPNIVPVYEVGEVEGQPFFAMKLVEGGSLAGRWEAYRAAPRDAARLVADVARAVHYAHQHGILHRDLKPSNILLDADGRPHVTDFGLAKRLGGAAGAELTQSGAIIGTPAYMAPEQASGRRGTVTTATDVYGLGSVLYALLTGRPPFAQDDVADVLDRLLTRDPEPPGRSNPRLGRDLELICLKCLQKEPGRRYPSALAVAEELERHLEGRPLALTRPVGRGERLWRWCRRNPAWAALALGMTLAAATIAVGSTVAYFRLRAANDQERASRIRAEENRVRAEENLKASLDAVAYFGTLSQEPQMQKRGLESVRLKMLNRAKEICTDLARQQPMDDRLELVLGQALIRLGRVTLIFGTNREAMAAFQQAREICERLVSEHPDLPDYQNVLVLAMLEQGTIHIAARQTEEAQTVLDEALARSKRLCEQQPAVPAYEEGLARAYFQQGTLHYLTGRADLARAAYGQAVERFEWLARTRPEPFYKEHLARTYLNIATAHMQQPHPFSTRQVASDTARVEKWLLAAQGILEKFDRENAEGQNILADVYYLLGRITRDSDRREEAMALFDKAVPIRITLSQKSDVPDYQLHLAILYHGQALNFSGMKQFDRAKQLFAKAAAVLEPVVRDYDLVGPRQQLGEIYFNTACLAGLVAADKKKADPPPADRQHQIDRLAVEAVEQLRKSWDTGFLQDRVRFVLLMADSDLDAFRDRDDFTTLVAELVAKLAAQKPAANP
jgi:tetratricopeptide (TPR) repeat protein/tRNA A-37 threonylcarbamoyl transferase component Bud32